MGSSRGEHHYWVLEDEGNEEDAESGRRGDAGKEDAESGRRSSS